MRYALTALAAACVALASSAMAETTKTSDSLSVLDAAIFVHPPTDTYDMHVGKATGLYLEGAPIVIFTPFAGTYSSSLQNIREIRRYGGRLTTSVGNIPLVNLIPGMNGLDLEAHGLRDFGTGKRYRQMYGAGVMKQLSPNFSVAGEANWYKSSLDNSHLPGFPGAWVFELNATYRFK
ncbi:MAG: hypothetical protein JWO84_528 [Parcubacteria group bacterium]|nr:hypothetical protein [Parcubacteria group bacterium]